MYLTSLRPCSRVLHEYSISETTQQFTIKTYIIVYTKSLVNFVVVHIWYMLLKSLFLSCTLLSIAVVPSAS
jgi:hypothetical protein